MRIRNVLLADADELARIMIDANQDAFRGLVPEQCLNWITPQESADNWRRTINRGADMNADDRLLVAETEHPSHLIGFVLVRVTDADEGSRAGSFAS